MAPRKLYNFLIDPDLADGLKRLKEREKEPESVIIRRALRRYLEEAGAMKSAKPARGKRAGKA
jgi:predicted transcriptional regulator